MLPRTPRVRHPALCLTRRARSARGDSWRAQTSTHRHRVTAGGAQPAVCVLAPQGSGMRHRGCRHLVWHFCLPRVQANGALRALPVSPWRVGSGSVGPRASGRSWCRAVMRDLRDQAGIVCVVVLEYLVRQVLRSWRAPRAGPPRWRFDASAWGVRCSGRV